MRTNRLLSVSPACLLICLLAAGIAQARNASTLPEASPGSVGFSAERLKRLEDEMQRMVDDKELAGVVTIIARHGKVIHRQAYGKLDVTKSAPLQKDSIVRIYSMTKPIIGVAMMMLYEEGKWKPSDPVSRYIPEFANLKVYVGGKDGQPVLETPKHAPTMGELMSHTAGFTYGIFGNSPVDKQYQQVNPLAASSPQAFIDQMAKLPLAYHPGEGWVYSVSVDIQGYLVEKLSGKPLPQFLSERIFQPLGMKDTAFFVPPEKMSRLATIYSYNAQQKALVGAPPDPGVNTLPGFPQGGGGLYSTADDYLLFTQMLLNGGQLHGARVLAPSSVQLMRSNRVPDAVKLIGKSGIGGFTLQPGVGFGLDFAVLEDPTKVGSTAGKGTYSWGGIAGTWFWIDPANDLVFVGIIQRRGGVPGAPSIDEMARQLTYQALVEPSK